MIAARETNFRKSRTYYTLQFREEIYRLDVSANLPRDLEIYELHEPPPQVSELANVLRILHRDSAFPCCQPSHKHAGNHGRLAISITGVKNKSQTCSRSTSRKKHTNLSKTSSASPPATQPSLLACRSSLYSKDPTKDSKCKLLMTDTASLSYVGAPALMLRMVCL